jgi:hypothetical protein
VRYSTNRTVIIFYTIDLKASAIVWEFYTVCMVPLSTLFSRLTIPFHYRYEELVLSQHLISILSNSAEFKDRNMD